VTSSRGATRKDSARGVVASDRRQWDVRRTAVARERAASWRDRSTTSRFVGARDIAIGPFRAFIFDLKIE
jgi:hypothetical protein